MDEIQHKVCTLALYFVYTYDCITTNWLELTIHFLEKTIIVQMVLYLKSKS